MLFDPIANRIGTTRSCDRAGCHSSCTVDVCKGTGGAGIPNNASIILFSNTRLKQKTRLSPRKFVRNGHRDPQTYALLYCSVFKEPTLPLSPFWTGSTTAPQGQGVRVNER